MLDYLKCPRCTSKLNFTLLSQNSEIDEGFLECDKCSLTFPIMQKIPILMNDLISYFSNRPSLGGNLYHNVSNQKMKLFFKDLLKNIDKTREDRTGLEERWVKIYQKSKRSRFYSVIKKQLESFSGKVCLEHGCSIGIVSEFLSHNNELVFGIDRSFSSITMAKKTTRKNLDYVVADSLSSPFGKQKFDLIVALNILELIEPRDFLQTVSKQIRGTFVISDPYDFDRGKYSVKQPVDEKSLRVRLEQLGFKISQSTKKPSKIAWNLQLNERTQLHYKSDLVICDKIQ